MCVCHVFLVCVGSYVYIFVHVACEDLHVLQGICAI